MQKEGVLRFSKSEVENLCAGASMDIQILRELFGSLLEPGKPSREEREGYEKILKKLPEIKVEDNGTIQEWTEPYEEVDKGHRHISHLFALYPAAQIDFFDKRLISAA